MNEQELDQKEKGHKLKRRHEIKIGIWCLVLGTAFIIFSLTILPFHIVGAPHGECLLCLGIIFIANPFSNVSEEIKLWRQLLKANKFEEIITIWQKIGEDLPQKIKHETLEKGMQLAKTPQQAALIYKISPAGSEIENKALKILIEKAKQTNM